MNDVSHNKKKDSILKSLAIAGFIGIIVLIAWLSVQLVHILPGAFASLASLAEGVNEFTLDTETDSPATITIMSGDLLVDAGETTTVTWDMATVPGSYTFSYRCAEGVAIDLINVDGLGSIACDTNYNIGNTDQVTFSIDSEKERYAGVTYTIAFLGTNDTTPRANVDASLTVINNTIEELLGDNSEVNVTEEVAVVEESVEPAEEVVPVVEPEPVVTDTTPVAPAPAAPAPVQEIIYAIPTSDPNGHTDLSVRFLNMGTIVGNTFFTGAVRQGEAGAIQFEVKNVGTKTSDTWNLTVTLPSGGAYELNNQVALKPNERAVITVGFPEATVESYTFTVTAEDTSDTYLLNNSFRQFITFVE